LIDETNSEVVLLLYLPISKKMIAYCLYALYFIAFLVLQLKTEVGSVKHFSLEKGSTDGKVLMALS
jgi:hypothetical protein